MMTETEYRQRELKMFAKQLELVEKQSLKDRREGAACFAQAIRDPGCVGRNVGWLLEGSYGFGAAFKYWRDIHGSRQNRVALLCQWIAALDHSCPASFARKEFSRLNPEEQAALNSAIQSAIDDATCPIDDLAELCVLSEE